MIIFNKKRDIRHSYIPLSAVGQNRTVDTRIFSPLLYRLSYNGVTEAILAVFPNYVNRKHRKIEKFQFFEDAQFFPINCLN